MRKHGRHLAIKQIITHRSVGTQGDLCKALRKAGYPVTQATLSRDLKQLGIARVNTPDGMRYELHPEIEELRLKLMLGYEVEQIDANENIIVVKTLAGRAQGVAQVIDGFNHPLILGTLAGDNTILVVPTAVKKIPDLLKALHKLMTDTKRVA
ncbi:MAG: arginine repressor [Ignavibacteria bacterium]|nr:arginine repressor [Ignavibacteria bacterium]